MVQVNAPAFMKSAYGKNDEPIVSVTQYSVTLVSSSSFVNDFSTSPSQSLHAWNLSTIHDARPTGESLSPRASV